MKVPVKIGELNGNLCIDPRIYPCAKCGVFRTKAEGGTTFTVCDKCWDIEHKKVKHHL